MPHQASGQTTAEEPTGLVDAVQYLLSVPEEIAPSAYAGPFAKVTYACGIIITHPNDKFQNVKPHVAIEVPCVPHKIEEAFMFGYEWVDGKLNEIRSAVLEAYGA